MSRLLVTSLVVLIVVTAAAAQGKVTDTEIVRDYDAVKDVTTVRLRPAKLSGPTDHYHSLTFSVAYAYAGKGAAQPKDFELELVSIVKARELNSDLYVLFVVNGEEIHFSSNRSAIPKPVQGKPWIGERTVFGLPREKYVKLAGAKKLSVKLGGVSFDFSEDQIADLRRILLVTH
jgi:hypothetical protein